MHTTAMATARTCPKCGHVRVPAEHAPAWQCPACGIAYHKYRSYLERTRAVMTPPAAAGPREHPAADGSVWMLVLSNVIAIGVAIAQAWPLANLMLLYWSQSVVIGVANVFRILSLDRFSTSGFTINDQPVSATRAAKVQVAFFFAAHYGLFHFVYLMFMTAEGGFAALTDIWLWICSAVFAVNHWFSHRYNRARDRTGRPNIGTLMFTPYLRIVPMHLTIIFGALLANAWFGMLLFGVLKTGADVAMHAIEHLTLQGRNSVRTRQSR